jgi:molybdenum cofactor cytidylyltransferase
MTIAAILLAAGESSRMGQPKPLLPWQGKTLVEAQIDSLLEGGADEVYVVTGKSDAAVALLLRGLKQVIRVHNPRSAEGKTTSVKAGVAALPANVTAIVLLAVDQPRPAWVVRRVIGSHIASGAPLTSPRYRGHGGHPLAFDAALRDELAAISEEKQGIREVFSKHEARMNRVEFESAIVRLDLNTPEAYEKALREYGELSRSGSASSEAGH